jgi:DNA-binding transcriptional LysR family regulator
MALTPILASLAQTHPRGVVEVHTNDAFVDIVAEGFDVGVRLGEAVQQDMVAVRIMPPSKPFSWPHRAALPLAARPCLWQS